VKDVCRQIHSFYAYPTKRIGRLNASDEGMRVVFHVTHIFGARCTADHMSWLNEYAQENMKLLSGTLDTYKRFNALDGVRKVKHVTQPSIIVDSRHCWNSYKHWLDD
jgi:hypothetical protein